MERLSDDTGEKCLNSPIDLVRERSMKYKMAYSKCNA